MAASLGFWKLIPAVETLSVSLLFVQARTLTNTVECLTGSRRAQTSHKYSGVVDRVRSRPPVLVPKSKWVGYWRSAEKADGLDVKSLKARLAPKVKLTKPKTNHGQPEKADGT